MSNASAICAARIIRTNAEGFRSDVYDDATGLPIECKGQPTNGYGTRCRQWSKQFAAGVMNLELEEFEEPLLQFGWYIGCNDARRSALLEIAYNTGDTGLETGWPHLIAAVTADNWTEAQAQCVPANPAQKLRYDRIGLILLTGEDQ